MHTKTLAGDGARSVLLVLTPGEKIVDSLLAFAREHDVQSAAVVGIGAVRNASLGFFHVDRKDYDRFDIEDQMEVLSLTGNLTWFDGDPRAHLHTVLGRPDGTCVGGHLFEAEVDPTLELLVSTFVTRVDRSIDERSGLPLIQS
jgi:uncharacterized protein